LKAPTAEHALSTVDFVNSAERLGAKRSQYQPGRINPASEQDNFSPRIIVYRLISVRPWRL